MARIIVTGGAGFIGSHIVDALVAKNHRVTIIDDLSTGRRQNVPSHVRLLRQDIRSTQLKHIFSQFRPQYVFHLAAQKNVRTSLERPLFDADVNIAGSLNIIEQCRRTKVKKIIFSSTGGALYGDGVHLPTPENVTARPESPYGIAKFTIEQYLRFYRKQFGLCSVALRYANVYGPRQDPKGEAGVVAIFAQKILRGEPLIINGHGRQTRDYVFVSDVVRANLLAIKNLNVTGEINIGTGKQMSVNALATTMFRVSDLKTHLKHRPALAGEVNKSSLSWKLAKKQLQWQPEVSMELGLWHTWEWAKGVLA